MSLKQEIETWVQALTHYDNNEFEDALRVFSNIADTSKVLFNCGVIHATIGEHQRAVDCYQKALGLDQYLAVAYFQQGVSNFLHGDFEEALANFNDALLYLRGNTFIDYEQLGLKFKLYSCEVLFNRGLCYIYLQQEQPGMKDFQYAVKEKMTPDHEVIDDAIREKAEGYTVFSIPVGILYRPNESKVKNLKTKDYLGRARLVATANANETGIGFQGAERRKETEALLQAKDDRPSENISYAATNLVHRNLGGRAREQSAPPTVGRSQFPTTTALDRENKFQNPSIAPVTTTAAAAEPPPRSASVRNPGPRNLPPLQVNGYSSGRAGSISNAFEFNLSADGTPKSSQRGKSNLGPSPRAQQEPWSSIEERPRLATARSASESRGPPPSRRLFMERTNSIRSPNLNGGLKPLYGETTRMGNPIYEDQEPADEGYSAHASRPRTSNTKTNQPPARHQPEPRAQPHYEQEYDEEEDEDIIIESDSPDEGNPSPFTKKPLSPIKTTSPRKAKSQVQSPQSAHSRTSFAMPITMEKIRIRVHAEDDIRYIMVPTPHVDYDDFESRVRAKFGLRGRLRMKCKDEDSGDMVTISDQDDLDTLVATAKEVARKEKAEMGKMEVWVQETSLI